jgi:alkylation response protein AidB-like acyl-CoA dehydrogenase
MHIDYTPEQKDLRRELREYFARLMTPEVRAKTRGMEGGEAYRPVVRQMGTDGWLGIGWPKEYGGQGRSIIDQMIFFEEVRIARAPFPFVTLNTVGPVLMTMGSEEQKKAFLPGIVGGEIHFAIGYSEPDAGTDLASLKTSAVRDGDDYIINGTKTYTSGADDADYIWLAARTDPEAKKHKGISILIADTTLPGFSLAPIHVIGDVSTCMTYYENVRVPASMRVGPENGGWALITSQLNHERVGLAAWGGAAPHHLRGVLEWARRTQAEDGRPVIAQSWVQTTLAEAHALLEAAKLMNWRMAWEMDQNRLSPADASAVKVFGTECLIEVYRLLLEVLGPLGTLKEGSPGAVLRGLLERECSICHINTFGGGVNEIQREIVSMLGLRMPRVAR